MNVTIKREGEDSVVIPIDEKAIYRKRLMAEWYIEIPTISHTILDIQIGDYIVFDSENYYVNRLPKVEKINNNTFSYTIIFDSVVSELNNKLFISSDGLSEYSYTGTPTDFVTNIVSSVNTISSGWTVGTCEALDARRMDFVNETCLSALTRVAEEFNLEFNIVSKKISLVKAVGSDTALVFQYGRGKGLYNITRQQIQDANILTRVYGFGGTRNIPFDYRSRAKRLVFAERYLEKNTELYGVIEGQFTDDNIYPQRTGQLTASNIIFVGGEYSTQYSYVADSSLDFDINNYLLEGQVAKIVFKTGDLAGLEFEISRYEHLADGLLPARRIYFNPYVDQDDSYSYPNFNGGFPVQCQIGDTYTLVDLKMPQSYVDTAEALLKSKTQEFIDENSVPRVIYEVNIDPRYAKTISFGVGDKVTIIDADLGINSLIRISGIDFPLTNTNKITALIADFVPYTLQERIIKKAKDTDKEVKIVDRSKAELARRNTMRQNQLKSLIYDTDGYFDNTNIRPLSIETMYLAVGAKSSDFFLSGVTIKANYGGDANSIYLGAGSLIHLQIAIAGLGYTWVLSQSVFDSLTPATAYYVYAKCSKSALTGEYVISASQITVEQYEGYYHFLLGSLFPVADGYRDFDFTYGMTYIVGNTITTGTIRSIDGLNYFNLTDGKFKIGDNNASLDWNVTTENKLTLKGALVQSPSGDTNPIITFRGAYSSETTYYKGDQVTYGGSSWNYINSTPASGQTPAEGAYWTVAASVGSAGTSGATATITPSKQVFNYNSNGDLTDSGSWFVVCSTTNLTGTLYYEWIINDITVQNDTYAAYNLIPPATYAEMPVKYQVKVRVGSSSSPVLAQDTITIYGVKDPIDGADGNDAYTVVLSNESHSLPSSSSGVVSSYSGSGTDILVWLGTTALAYGSGASTFDITVSGTDITVGSASTVDTYTRRFADHSNMTSDLAKVTFTIKVRNANNEETTFTRVQSLTKSKAGTSGENGSSIVFRGEFSATAVYFNNIYQRDAVKYSDAYYLYKGTNGVSGAWSAGNWESFGSSWSSVATGLLLAERAFIENLIAKEFATASSGARVTINELGTGQKICIYDSSGVLKLVIQPSDITTRTVIEAGTGSESDTTTAVSTSQIEKLWDESNGWGIYVESQYSNSFEVSLDGILEITVSNILSNSIATQKISADGVCQIWFYLQKYINSEWVRVGTIGFREGSAKNISGTIKAMSKGTYRLEAYHYHQGFPVGDYDEDATVTTISSWGYISGSTFTISTVSVLAQTEIGTNGFCSVWSSTSYFYYTANGWFVRGLPNSSSGLSTGQIWNDNGTLKIV